MENTTDSERDQQTKMLERHSIQLSEHFDTVQIICTRADGDETVSLDGSVGNWFARYGSVREWVIRQEEMMKSME